MFLVHAAVPLRTAEAPEVHDPAAFPTSDNAFARRRAVL